MNKQTKKLKKLAALLTVFGVIFISSCSTEELIDIDLTHTETEAETAPAETTDSTYETAVTTTEQVKEYTTAEETEPMPSIPPDRRSPYEGIELLLSDAVEINDANEAIYDFSYIRYGTEFYMDSNYFNMNGFSYDNLPSLQNIKYIKVEKGQEISDGLKVANAQLWLAASYPDSFGYSDVTLSEIELEGSVTWEGFLWFVGDDEPMFGGLVRFAADPTANSRIPLNIETGAGLLYYSNDEFSFIMDSESIFVGDISNMDIDIELILREKHCVRVRATLTDIRLQCDSKSSGYNHSHAKMTDVEILQ